MDKDRGILLESGTNELEIVEFGIAKNRFGINVIKVREIINPVLVTPVPHSHPHVEGILELRGEALPVINIAASLGFPDSVDQSQDKFIVSEFNKQKVVFRVHSVTQIHRISWTQIEKPSQMYQGLDTQIIGVIKMNSQMLLLLDFEKIVLDINPEAGINVGQVKKLGERDRSDKRIVVAEDSALLRKLIHDTLGEAGYVLVDFFENGQEALNYLGTVADRGGDVTKHVQLVITDIEMPQMDGHHLTRRIREDNRISHLPIIIFSSLITEELRHKGERVGANAQVSKPEIGELIKTIDTIIL